MTMCFYSEPDWTAQVVVDEVLAATDPVGCDECRRTIGPGEARRHVFMQEHERCRHDPDHDDYDAGWTAEKLGLDVGSLPEEGCPPGCEHDLGETYDYTRCMACDQLVEAIHRHEIDEGCPEDESRPNLCELLVAMQDGDGRAYLAKAEGLFPGITARLPAAFLDSRKGD